MTCVQDLPHRDTVSRRYLEYFQVVSTEKEVLKKSATGASNLIQLPIVREEPKGSGQVQVPTTLKEGKSKSLPSPRHDNTVEPGLLQQAYNNPGSSTYQDQHTSRVSNTWVRVETDSIPKSEDLSKKEGTGSKVPQISASIDGWICVERPIPPPMTWEDALKVAQKAREAAVDATSKTRSPLTCKSEPNFGLAPLISQASREIQTSSQIVSGHEAGLSPFPLPPKSSPSRISEGCVKDRINAFESSVLQAPDPLVSKLENEKVPADTVEPTTAEMPVMAKDETQHTAEMPVLAKDETEQSPEPLKKWDDRGRNKGQSPRDVANKGDCRSENPDSFKSSSKQELQRDSIAKDQEPRLSDGCQPSSYNKQVVERRLDPKLTTNLTNQDESRDTLTAYRLPKPQEVIVEAMENQSQLKSLTGEKFMSSMEERLSHTSKGEVGNIQNKINCDLVSHMQVRASMAEFGGKEEGKTAVAKSNTLFENEPVKTKDVDSQESKVTPEKHTESHYSNTVRRLRNPLGSPKPTHLDKQKPSRPGGSLQAWKDLQDSLEQKGRKLYLLKRAILKENFKKADADKDQGTSKSIDDELVAAVNKIDISIKKKPEMLLEHKQLPPISSTSCVGTSHKMAEHFPLDCPTLSEDMSHKTVEVSNSNDNKILSHLGSSVKQVLSGVVILAGLFALWPRDRKRYHVVKAGETPSHIAPEQCIDSSSHFCKINPQVHTCVICSEIFCVERHRGHWVDCNDASVCLECSKIIWESGNRRCPICSSTMAIGLDILLQ